MKSKLKILFSLFLIVFVSCSKKENEIENEKIKVFKDSKDVFLKSNEYLKDVYFPIYLKTSRNIKITLSDSFNIRKNIYYDKYLNEVLKNKEIKSIFFRKNKEVCEGFDIEVFYEIYPVSNRQYYYVFDFCNDGYDKTQNTPNYKIIPLIKGWSLEVEKD